MPAFHAKKPAEERAAGGFREILQRMEPLPACFRHRGNLSVATLMWGRERTGESSRRLGANDVCLAHVLTLSSERLDLHNPIRPNEGMC